jgi:hypothetical protein
VNVQFLTTTLLVGLPLFGLPLFGQSVSIDCSHESSLQTAIDNASPGETLLISGTCAGPVTLKKNLTIAGSGAAAIDGHGKDAVTVNGPARVTLQNLDIQNGANGLVGNSAAQLTLLNVSVHDNASTGIFLEANSSATLSGGSAKHNGLNGIDAEATSAVIFTGTYVSEANAVFGIEINASSSLTFTQANVTADQNTLGVQIGTSAGAFISDSASTLTVKQNATTGLTIVSGGQMVDFGGTINAIDNQGIGVSVDSKAGLDLDAAGTLTSTGNALDGVHLEESGVMTIFNTPAFSGAPGNTTVTSQNNGGNGISILTGSNLTMIHQAAINSNHNTGNGVQADSGSSLTLIQSNITGNKTDIALTFGSRADLRTSTIGTITCDATVLVRGDTGAICPTK